MASTLLEPIAAGQTRFHMQGLAPDGRGIAVYSPGSTQPWNFGPHAGGASEDPAAGPCVHVAPIDRVLLGPRSVYRFRYWLVLGRAPELAARLDTLRAKYAAATFVWCQEEPANMGAWTFVRDRFDWQRHATRRAAASPATGSSPKHKAEQAAVVAAALGR